MSPWAMAALQREKEEEVTTNTTVLTVNVTGIRRWYYIHGYTGDTSG